MDSKRMRLPDFAARKRQGEKIVMLTAYDATMARLLDRAGVDALLVGEEELREHGALLELEVAAAFVVLQHDLRADDVGRHQVRGELDARELEVQCIAQGFHEQRLPQSGHALEQRMAGREQAGEDAVDQRMMPDDPALDLAAQDIQPLAGSREARLVDHGAHFAPPGDCARVA